jgi:hypothetical protein
MRRCITPLAAAGDKPRHALAVGVAMARRDDGFVDASPQRFVSAPAEDRLGARVPVGDAAPVIDAEDRVQRVVEHGAQPRPARHRGAQGLMRIGPRHHECDIAEQQHDRRGLEGAIA